MNWDNLKLFACPVCMGKLEKTTTGFKCSHFDPAFHNVCTFRISSAKFENIVDALYQPKPKKCGFTNNFERLQNL